MNEEAEGSGRTVSKATMIVLYQVTALFVVQVFVAGLLVPSGTEFADGDPVNNAFYNVVGTAMAGWFKTILLLTAALIATFANTIASNATSSRLVFSTARDGQLPKFLSRVSDRHQVLLNADLHRAPVGRSRHPRRGAVGTADHPVFEFFRHAHDGLTGVGR